MLVRVQPGVLVSPKKWKRAINTTKDKSLGYLYFMDREHPLGDKKGRVWHHRHVMSVRLGRWVTEEEIVHHKDADRSNNHSDNLEVTTQRDHAREHIRMRGYEPLEDVECACGKVFHPRASTVRFCSPECGHQSRRKFDVTKEELATLLEQLPVVAIAKKFGVSDVAVHQRARRLGLK